MERSTSIARVRAVHAQSIGDQALSVHAYGLDEHMPPAVLDRPQGIDEWVIMGFSSPAQVWVDGAGGQAGLRDVAADTLILWRPQAKHYYGLAEKPWRHSWIFLNGDNLDTLVATLGLALETPIHGIPCAWLDAAIQGLHDEISSQSRPNPHILAAYLDILLRRVARGAAGGVMVPAGLLAVHSHIEANFTGVLRLPALARLAGCSVPHLCAGFRRHFAVSPIDLAIRLRLDHARRLLSERGMTVASAAESIGYADYRHFTRLYRQRYGHSPRRGDDVAR